MTHLVEKYLERVGPRLSTILLLTLLVWICIALGVVLYALGMGVYRTVMITREAFDGEPRVILLSVVIWVFVLLSLPLGWAARRVWQEHRGERWGSEGALDRLERQLFPDEQQANYTENARERLALRSLSAMELEVLGELQSSDLTIEERVIALESRMASREEEGS
jgi:hypothetical protein